MSTALKNRMTADEFLRWAEGKEGRWELHDGAPVMMSPERMAHIRTKARAVAALEGAVRNANLLCEVFADGLSVQVDSGAIFEPDASVVCGPRRSDDTIVITDPTIVVEVLSPGDTIGAVEEKLRQYFENGSRLAWVVNPMTKTALVYHGPSADKLLTLKDGLDGEAVIPGFLLPLEQVFS